MADICTNFTVPINLNPKFDIIWSFEYSIVGGEEASAGFTTFLYQTGGNLLNGGEYSSLGYGPKGSRSGISEGYICIGLDSDGEFSKQYLMNTGVNYNNSDTLTVRSKKSTDPFYLIDSFPLSSYEIPVVTQSEIYNRLKFCLTDSGNTLHMYCLDKASNEYFLVKTVKPNLNIAYNPSNPIMLNVGFSYASPVKPGMPKAIFNIKNVNVQGVSTSIMSVASAT